MAAVDRWDASARSAAACSIRLQCQSCGVEFAAKSRYRWGMIALVVVAAMAGIGVPVWLELHPAVFIASIVLAVVAIVLACLLGSSFEAASAESADEHAARMLELGRASELALAAKAAVAVVELIDDDDDQQRSQ